MTAPRLSLCMIAKNEARWIATALERARPLVDEMIVVDTGSTDDTPELARAQGAQVSTFAWCDDFAAARNASLERATGEWVLVLDADECISPGDHAAIRTLIAEPRSLLYSLVQTTYCRESATYGWIPNRLTTPEAEGHPGYFESPLARLFRRIPEIRFHGVVHEHAGHRDPSVVTIDTPLRIHHYGKLAAASATTKSDLYLRLGEAKCRAQPDDAHAWYELGVQYWTLERTADAMAALQRAVQLAPRYVRPHIALAGIAHAEKDAATAARHYATVLELDPTNVIPYLYLPGLLQDLGDLSAAEQVLAVGLRHFPDYPPLHINRAVVQLGVGNYRGAASACRQALALHADEPLAEYNLGVALLRLEEWDAARVALERAAQAPTTRRSAQKQLVEWHFRRRDLAAAEALLEALIAEGPVDAELLSQLAVVQIQRDHIVAARRTLARISDEAALSAALRERLVQCRRAVAVGSA